jgi:hypothetical protein
MDDSLNSFFSQAKALVFSHSDAPVSLPFNGWI